MSLLPSTERAVARRILIAGTILASAFGSLHAQGFTALMGAKKPKTTTLKRLLPPTVNLNQKRINLVAVPVGGSKADAATLGILRTKLLTSIQKDNRFVLDEANPETLLKFTITNYYVEQKPVTVQGTNPPQTCPIFTGKLESSYQAIDVASNAPLDSENLTFAVVAQTPKGAAAFKMPFGTKQAQCANYGKATANEARDELIDGIVAQMSQRAAPAEELVTVPLPGGKLEPLSSLAAAQRWGTLLEEAEKTEKLPKPEDDSYRVYLIGLANEGLAYDLAHEAADREKSRRNDVTSANAKQSMAEEDKNLAAAQTYIDKATKAYKDAIQAKSSEKVFREPDARMENAVRLYATIMRVREEYKQALLAKKAPISMGAADTRAVGASSPDPAAPPVPPSQFATVINMCRDHEKDIPKLIEKHWDEFEIKKNPNLAEDRLLKKECGADTEAIEKQIELQLAKKSPAAAPVKK